MRLMSENFGLGGGGGWPSISGLEWEAKVLPKVVAVGKFGSQIRLRKHGSIIIIYHQKGFFKRGIVIKPFLTKVFFWVTLIRTRCKEAL